LINWRGSSRESFFATVDLLLISLGGTYNCYVWSISMFLDNTFIVFLNCF
jgi:hypothetical protein